MQFESLKVFCDVVRYRSFSQAAAANDVTQSAASQVVSQLEKRMGVQLIDRSTRPLQLTELGKSYYEGCHGLVEQYLELEASIRDRRSELESTVQVAAIYSVGLGDMGQYVERFHELQPNARVHLEYLHPDRVYEKVMDGTADFGLVSFPRKARELICLPWRDEEMVLVCSPAHALAACRAVRPGQLNGESYVGFDKHLGIRKEVDRFLREHGVEVQVTMEFDNIENIKKAVEIGAGVALLPEPTIRHEVAAGTLVAVPLAGCRLVRPLGIIQNRHHQLSATALRFRDLLRHANGGMSSRLSGHANGEAARSRNGRSRHAGPSVANGRNHRSRPKKDTVT